jgi:hypothetical protein
MRITSLVALGVLACGTAFSASRSETITYVDGNVTGISPHTGGTLLFSDEAALTFRTNSQTVKIPYSSISKAALGGTISHSHDVPMYKVWELPKRVFPKKTQTQFLTVDFKNEAGESRTMTLELAEASASKVLSTIDSRKATLEAAAPATSPDAAATAGTPGSAEAPNAAPAPKTVAQARGTKSAKATTPRMSDADWWGNGVWKTARNADKWPQSGTVAAGGQE